HRYIVSDIKHIIVLSQLFNGHLFLPHRIAQLGKWIEFINNSSFCPSPIFTFITVPFVPSLLDAWMAGFTDAEGCFNINITARASVRVGYRVHLRFILDQKDAQTQLVMLRDMIGHGNVSPRSDVSSNYRLIVDSFGGMEPIVTYFSLFPLKTKKQTSFKLWLEARDLIEAKAHLTFDG
ncbi:homing endonuclease, partial [Chytriomyces cf. hyalinus JEL632]